MNKYLTLVLVQIILVNFVHAKSDLFQSKFIYTPEFSTEYRNMNVDENGITVVVENRYHDEFLNSQFHMVLYRLTPDSLSLEWFKEDIIWARVIDSVITQSNIYVLHKVKGQSYKMALSNYSLNNGSLLWRVGIGGDLDEGQYLRVNENTNQLIVIGENQEISQLWRFDTIGNLQSHMSIDIANSQQENNPVFGIETIYDVYFHPDDSVVLLAIMEAAITTRLIYINPDNTIRFDHKFDQIQHSFFNKLNLSVSNDNKYLITLIEESLFGISRFVQYALNENGQLLFVNQTDNFLHWIVDFVMSSFLSNGTILNVTDVSIGGPATYEMFATELDGQFSPLFSYTYQNEGSLVNNTKSLLTENDELFIVVMRRNVFPDQTYDSIYLQWHANGQLCSEFVNDGSDSYAFIKSYNNIIYELRYRGLFEKNGRYLQVVKHLSCNNDLIFKSSFEQ